MASDWHIYQGGCKEVMTDDMEDRSVQTVVTSPPYYGLRDYGDIHTIWNEDVDCDHAWESVDDRSDVCDSCGAWKGQLGLEPLHDCGRPDGDLCGQCYVCHIVETFRRVRRVLRDDGTVWLNIGDSYSSGSRQQTRSDTMQDDDMDEKGGRGSTRTIDEKNLFGIPWRVAMALQEDGWYLRSSIVWAKGISGQNQIQSDLDDILRKHRIPESKRHDIIEDVDCHVGNVMPESTKDRPTKAYEYVFLLSKESDYFYDDIAIRENPRPDSIARMDRGRSDDHKYEEHNPGNQTITTKEGTKQAVHTSGRNRRNVWCINTQGYSDSHFAVSPPSLVEPCIKAGTSKKGACPECGAPYERVVERKDDQNKVDAMSDTKGDQLQSFREDRDDNIGRLDGGRRHQEGSTFHNNPRKRQSQREFRGWTSTCDCDTDDDPMPCRVLDPFAGAGTTVMGANRLDREGVGIEISEEYVEMAEDRIEEDMRDRLAPWEGDYPEPDEEELEMPDFIESIRDEDS